MSQDESAPQGPPPTGNETVSGRASRSPEEDSRLDAIERALIQRFADSSIHSSIREQAETRLRSLDSWRIVFASGAYVALACAGVLAGLILAGYIGFAPLDKEDSLWRLGISSAGCLIVFLFARFFAAALDRAVEDVREATAHLTPISKYLAGLFAKGVDRPKDDAATIAG